MESTQSLTVNNGSTYSIMDKNRIDYGEERDDYLKKIRAAKGVLSQNEKDAWKERIKALSLEELEYIATLIDPLILANALTEYVCNMGTLQNSVSKTYEMMKSFPCNTSETYLFGQARCNWNTENGSNEKAHDVLIE